MVTNNLYLDLHCILKPGKIVILNEEVGLGIWPKCARIRVYGPFIWIVERGQHKIIQNQFGARQIILTKDYVYYAYVTK